MQPAKVSRVTVVDRADKHLEVIVDDSQLSLAIGKKGQNVRLAAKLLGWKIDIKSEEEKRQEVEQQMSGDGRPVLPRRWSSVTELGEGMIEKLIEAGITTVEALADMTPEQLEEDSGHRREDGGKNRHRGQQLLLPALKPARSGPGSRRDARSAAGEQASAKG